MRAVRRRAATAAWALSGALLLAGVPGLAQDKKAEAREREALRRAQAAQAELKRVQLERDELAKAKEALAGQAERLGRAAAAARTAAAKERERGAALEKELETARRELDAQRKQVETLAAQSKQLGERLAAAQVALAEGEARERGLGETVAARDAALRSLETRLAAGERRFEICEAHNAKLHGLGVELLEHYAGLGFGEALRRAEPFTRLRSVQLENLLQDYRDRLDAERDPVRGAR